MRSATVLLLLAALLGAAPATAAYAAPSNGSVSSVAYGRGGSGSHDASGGRHSALVGAGTVELAYRSRSVGTNSSSHVKEWWEVVLVLVVYVGFFGYVGYLGVKKVRQFFRRNA
ncbi:hypothetical protein [Streptomyces sioyaensis]|uniref:hypothetical protein n=1 Tax=Streptomyces sioyaensis TaxID=67364 RepID=UPI0037B1F143